MSIVNKIGIDVSNAIAALVSLRKGLDATGASVQKLAKSKTANFSLSNSMQLINNKAKKAKESLDAVGKSATKAAKELKKTGTVGTKSANSLTLSWKTMARVIQTQVIVRALNALKNAFVASVDEARKFGLAIAEIQTIAHEAFGSNEQLAGSVRGVADALGRTSQEVAEGLYQTLSNQVVEASRAFNFLTTAQKLATITSASTADAVGAISSVMNSYGESAGNAAETADILFKAVELGRLRLSDIANVLGRVTPLTAELGISFKEVASTLVVMTKQGVKADTALTQIRAITQKLLKPTEQMVELYKKWGVRDGQTAIKTFGGLRGVLNKVWEETGKNAAQMAKYFNRVRAVVGVLGALNKDGKELNDTMKKMEKATGAAKKAWDKFIESDAHKLTASINQLKNTFVTFGTLILPVVNDFVTGMNLILTSIGKTLDGVSDKTDKFVQKLKADLTKATVAYEDTLENWEGITEKEIDKVLEEEYRLLAEGNIIWDKHTAHIETVMKAMSDNIERSLEDAFDTGAFSTPLKDFVTNFDKTNEALNKSLKKNTMERLESAGKGKLPNHSSYLANTRALAEANQELSASIGKVFTAEQFKASEATASHAKELGKLGIEYAKATGKQWKINLATKRYRKTLRLEEIVIASSLKARKEKLDLVKKANDELTKGENRRMAAIPALKKLYEELADAQTPEAAQAIRDKIDAEMTASTKDLKEWIKNNKNLLEKFSLDDLADKFTSQTADKLENMHVEWGKQIAQMQEAFNNADMVVKATIDPTGEKTEAAREFLGRPKGLKEPTSDYLGEADKGAKELVAKQSHLEGVLDAAKGLTDHLRGPLKDAQKDFNRVSTEAYAGNLTGLDAVSLAALKLADHFTGGNERVQAFGQAMLDAAPKTTAYLEALKEANLQLESGRGLTEEQLAAIDKTKSSYENSAEATNDHKVALEGVSVAIKKFNAALNAQKTAKGALLDEKDVAKAKAVVTSLLTEAEKVKGAMVGTNQAILNSTNNLPGMQTAVGNVASATGGVETAWDGVIGKIKQATTAAVQAIAQIAAATAAASAGKASAGAAHYRGGPQYLAMGGQGQDTIPAMLSPGEFVINADSSKKFFSELNAINSGSQPVYREQGGSITNVGDVNVTVNGGDSSQQTVREIGHALKRELRRGTIKL